MNFSTDTTEKRTEHIQYRPDIDGLRAIAVIPVVIFHVFHEFFPGGFLGVDIFFVISGYLITSIIVKDCYLEKFSIYSFYERRIRRIIPALLFVLLITAIFSSLILLPGDLLRFGQSVIATVLFFSNIYFWRDTNYFSTDAQTKPLLHTWSLGVEEQFYIFYPILVFLVLRYRSELTLLWVIVAGSIISFVAAAAMIAMNLNAVGFYLLPMRGWELGIGAIAFLVGQRLTPSRMSARAFSLIGAIAIIASLAIIGQGSLARLPPATFLCLGTAILLWAGNTPNLVARGLSLAPLVGIGLISYSLYLWHWPIYVLTRYYLVRELTFVESCAVFLASFGMAYASWRFVEKPFRNRRMAMPRLFAMNAAPATALSGIVAVGLVTGGLPSRFSEEATLLNRNIGDIYKCPLTAWTQMGGARACRINGVLGPPAEAQVALFGNSHALMYMPAVEEALKQEGRHGLLYYSNGCLPLLGVNTNKSCAVSQEINARAVISNPSIKVVIIAFAWEGLNSSLYDSEKGRSIGKVPQPRLAREFSRVVKSFEKAGKKVVIVGPIPNPGFDVASTVSREVAFYGEARSALGQSRSSFEREFEEVEDLLDQLSDSIITLRPASAFCDQERCSFQLGNMVAFADNNHLTQDSARQFAPLFKKAIDQALSQSPKTAINAPLQAQAAPPT